MISVDKALGVVLSKNIRCGLEKSDIKDALGKILAEDIVADRDLPAENRATMDGIAINSGDLVAGLNSLNIKAIQGAGDSPLDSLSSDECVQIMTGASLPNITDTVIPIENLSIKNMQASFDNNGIQKWQYVHKKAADSKKGDCLVRKGQPLTPNIIPIASSVGKSKLLVAKPPKTIVITTGGELVDIDKKPTSHQIRQSNNYAIASLLSPYNVDFMHIKDDKKVIKNELARALNDYELVIISGGVSKGEYDFIPEILENLSLDIHFHGVAQKPGKPLLFGTSSKSTVFALPGNPVSTYLCMCKYVLPWLEKSMNANNQPKLHASLASKVTFEPKKTYYLQVRLKVNEKGHLVAKPIKHNGSGDYASLAGADAFIELPSNKSVFNKGEVYPIIPIKRSVLL